jgi:ribosomal protein L11 methyltransferase PrmA
VLKAAIKKAALRAFPGPAMTLFSIRSRRQRERLALERGLVKVTREVSSLTGGCVASGPFAGMRLDYEMLPDFSACLYAGTCEKELHRAIEEIVKTFPKRVLNVGCHVGYYAIGFALHLPGSAIFASDTDPKARRATRRNAELNGVSDRVSCVGLIQPGQLDRYLEESRSFLMMDCEGAEFELLDPRKDPVLQKTDIIVELHPEYGSKKQIVDRFRRTHRITEIQLRARTTADAPEALAGIDALSAITEWRSTDQSWLFMQVSSEVS